jgi:hypothetical protein
VPDTNLQKRILKLHLARGKEEMVKAVKIQNEA